MHKITFLHFLSSGSSRESSFGATKGKEDSLSPAKAGREDGGLPLGTDIENYGVASPLRDKEDTLDVRRVCQCSENDKKGEAAFEYYMPPQTMVQKVTR